MSTLVRGQWPVENRLHYVGDVTFGKDASRVGTGTAPAALRNLVITTIRRAEATNIAARRWAATHASNML